MSQIRRYGQTRNLLTEPNAVKAGAVATRREWLQGTAALGAALALSPDAAIAEAAAPGQLLVGAGKRVITPNPLLPVSGGMGPTHATREKRGELTARAIYLRRDATAVAVVSLDLLGFPSVLADRVRARVPRIGAENVIIGSTHTHSASTRLLTLLNPRDSE